MSCCFQCCLCVLFLLTNGDWNKPLYSFCPYMLWVALKCETGWKISWKTRHEDDLKCFGVFLCVWSLSALCFPVDELTFNASKWSAAALWPSWDNNSFSVQQVMPFIYQVVGILCGFFSLCFTEFYRQDNYSWYWCAKEWKRRYRCRNIGMLK